LGHLHDALRLTRQHGYEKLWSSLCRDGEMAHLLEGAPPELRAMACEVLGRLDGPEPRAVLSRLGRDRIQRVRRAARHALVRHDVSRLRLQIMGRFRAFRDGAEIERALYPRRKVL